MASKIKSRDIQMIFTCEHGGNQIPNSYKKLFSSVSVSEAKVIRKALESHRGWDIGALDVARALAKKFAKPLIFSEVSRLLIDLNRTATHPRAFSEWTNSVDPTSKGKIITRYHEPYRTKVMKSASRLSRDRLIHFSVHSFTPELHGKVRKCEIGLLHDPKRKFEREAVVLLKKHLQWSFPDLRVRLNYPYFGTSDGLTTTLRSRLPESRYAGIEFEFNQALLVKIQKRGSGEAFSNGIAWSIAETLQALQ